MQLFLDTSPEICIACHNTVVKALFELIQIILEYGNKIVQYGITKEKLEVSLDGKKGLGISQLNQSEW